MSQDIYPWRRVVQLKEGRDVCKGGYSSVAKQDTKSFIYNDAWKELSYRSIAGVYMH